MELFDTHFHYSGEVSPQEYYARITADAALCSDAAGNAELKHLMLAAGGSYQESVNAQNFAETIEQAYFACGVHPHQAAEYMTSKEDFAPFKGHEKLVSVGEIGLDYFYEESPRDEQLQVFEKFLNLALEWDKPAMLHLRDQNDRFDAYFDALELIKPFAAAGGRFVIHCCTAPSDIAGKFLEHGAMIGVTGIITFKAANNVREMLKIVPDDRLLIETDSPYLAPVPFRGRENTPGLITMVAEKLACERGMTIETIAALTTANAKRFYRIND